MPIKVVVLSIQAISYLNHSPVLMDFRTESDLLGDLQIPNEAYYGVQTKRASENFRISNQYMSSYPELIQAFGYVKKAAARTNFEFGILSENIYHAIIQACEEVVDGRFNNEFPIDMIQGGAGTSANMNANEVIANRALEIMGHAKGDYAYCSPNDHVNLSQSTNDAFPTAIKIALHHMNDSLVRKLDELISALAEKSEEFSSVIKMGRTQLQDAVPMTLGQEFEAFRVSLSHERRRLLKSAEELLEINMGGTAVGTGINAPQGFADICAQNVAQMTGIAFRAAENLIEATPDTSSFVCYSSSLKGLAVKLSKICNDLRLLSSGPRAGLAEIKLPAVQPGSSIMPGKVNPVIPEVVNQVCFKVIGNDLTVTCASEAAQLQLNVMEPVICHSIMESIQFLINALDTLTHKCVTGITANAGLCLHMVKNSVGIVTALNPYIGYKNSTKIAKEALATGKSVYSLVLEHGILSQDRLDEILSPESMLRPHEVSR